MFQLLYAQYLVKNTGSVPLIVFYYFTNNIL